MSATLISASRDTVQQGTAYFSTTVDLTVNGQSDPTPVLMSGEEDFTTKASDTRISSGVTEAEIRDVNGVAYLWSPLLHLPGGALWVAVTPSDLGGKGSVASGNSLDNLPSNGIQFLAGVNGAQVVGKTQIDGASVTTYSFTLDLLPLLDSVGRGTSKLDPG